MSTPMVIEMEREETEVARLRLRQAHKAAWEQSDDLFTKNGAVLCDADGAVVSVGANRLPEGVSALPERLERPAKYDYLIHAEEDAVAWAARSGRSTLGGSLYCPWAACPICARLIIQAGLKQLVVHSPAIERTPPRWRL